MNHEPQAEQAARDPDTEFDRRRWERIGEHEGPLPKESGRARRTFEDCARETEEQRRLEIHVICRPTWEGLKRARRRLEARLKE